MARILIVDDEEMDRVLMRTLLEADEHELIFARDGEAAFEVTRETDVDLVITDLAMPSVNGLRLIKDLRAKHDDTPIIAISGWAQDQLDLAEDLGANFSLFKPLDGEKFMKTVRKALTPPDRQPPPNYLFGR